MSVSPRYSPASVAAGAGEGRGLARGAEAGLVEVAAGPLLAEAGERGGGAGEAARGVKHARARLGPGDADDPAHGAARARLGLERLRDRRPRLAEEAFALEHAGYYSRCHDRGPDPAGRRG